MLVRHRTTAATVMAVFVAGLFSAPGHAAGLADKLAPNSVRVSHYLNFDMPMPTVAEAISAEAAVAAVRARVNAIAGGTVPMSGAKAEYWRDYATVVQTWSDVSSAKPVFYDRKDGERLVARYLVGLRRSDGDEVGGFFTVDARDGAIIADLMWTPDLEPLWRVPAGTWDGAASANDIDEVAELLPPLDQFTSGIPIDPHERAWTIVDGFVDEMPAKTQEERRAQVESFNRTHGEALGVELKAKLVRRIATLKCMSVAASYAADWWSVRCGRTLPTYKNAVGGQKEYGINPRVVESLYFQRRSEVGFVDKLFGDWKTAPFAHDPVTGEKVPFSPRGIARILAETGAGTVADPLVPSLLQYDTTDHYFAMDQKPVVSQVFTSGIFPSCDMNRDLERAAEDPSFPVSLAPEYGTDMTPERLAKAIDTWGPHLAQHMQRTYGGKSRTSLSGMGVHCCLIVGYGMYDDRLHFVYRETFGAARSRYLEDYFMGPEYRIMPAEYFYQAIGFPHHLYLTLTDFGYEADASLVGTLTVTTNGGTDLVDADRLIVEVDGVEAEHARISHKGRGTYRLWLPIGTTAHSQRIVIRASTKYFADAAGRPWFGVVVERPDGHHWEVQPGKLEATAGE